MSDDKKSVTPSNDPTIIEADLLARRRRLAGDLEQLGERLAPEALKSQAKDTSRTAANEVVSAAKSQVRSALADAQDKARLRFSELTGRAGELASDARYKAEELGNQARTKADSVSTDARLKAEELSAQARTKADEAKTKASETADAARARLSKDESVADGSLTATTRLVDGEAAPVGYGALKDSEVKDSFDPAEALQSAGDRVTRLFDDARDGEPQSLAIVTGAALGLAGLSVTALVKALRS